MDNSIIVINGSPGNYCLGGIAIYHAIFSDTLGIPRAGAYVILDDGHAASKVHVAPRAYVGWDTSVLYAGDITTNGCVIRCNREQWRRWGSRRIINEAFDIAGIKTPAFVYVEHEWIYQFEEAVCYENEQD